MKTTLTKEREIAVACLSFLAWGWQPWDLIDNGLGTKKEVSSLATTYLSWEELS